MIKVEKETLGNVKIGKAPDIDGITGERVRCGGDAVVEWMLWIYFR